MPSAVVAVVADVVARMTDSRPSTRARSSGGACSTQREPLQSDADAVEDWQLHRAASHDSTGLPSAENIALDELPDEEIKAALSELSEDRRLAVYLADVEGFSYKEIAEIMDTPIGTVMSRLHRGRRQLRELLADHARQLGYTTTREGR